MEHLEYLHEVESHLNARIPAGHPVEKTIYELCDEGETSVYCAELIVDQKIEFEVEEEAVVAWIGYLQADLQCRIDGGLNPDCKHGLRRRLELLAWNKKLLDMKLASLEVATEAAVRVA